MIKKTIQQDSSEFFSHCCGNGQLNHEKLKTKIKTCLDGSDVVPAFKAEDDDVFLPG